MLVSWIRALDRSTPLPSHLGTGFDAGESDLKHLAENNPVRPKRLTQTKPSHWWPNLSLKNVNNCQGSHWFATAYARTYTREPRTTKRDGGQSVTRQCHTEYRRYIGLGFISEQAIKMGQQPAPCIP